MPSDWKAGGLKKRDAQHTKTEETSPGRGKKKDTKRWCKGKVGRVHIPGCRKEYMTLSHDKQLFLGYQKFCITCGKELDFWRGGKSWLGTKKPRPDWAVD